MLGLLTFLSRARSFCINFPIQWVCYVLPVLTSVALVYGQQAPPPLSGNDTGIHDY